MDSSASRSLVANAMRRFSRLAPAAVATAPVPSAATSSQSSPTQTPQTEHSPAIARWDQGKHDLEREVLGPVDKGWRSVQEIRSYPGWRYRYSSDSNVKLDPAFRLREGTTGKASTRVGQAAIVSPDAPERVEGMKVNYSGTDVETENHHSKSQAEKKALIYRAFGAANSSLPEHEHGHLKIAVCGANYFNSYLLSRRYIPEDQSYMHDRKGLFAEVDKAIWYMQFQYERETQHGTSRLGQKRWTNRLDKYISVANTDPRDRKKDWFKSRGLDQLHRTWIYKRFKKTLSWSDEKMNRRFEEIRSRDIESGSASGCIEFLNVHPNPATVGTDFFVDVDLDTAASGPVNVSVEPLDQNTPLPFVTLEPGRGNGRTTFRFRVTDHEAGQHEVKLDVDGTDMGTCLVDIQTAKAVDTTDMVGKDEDLGDSMKMPLPPSM